MQEESKLKVCPWWVGKRCSRCLSRWRRQKGRRQVEEPPTRVPRRVELAHLLAGAPVGAPAAAPHAVAALEHRRHGWRAAEGHKDRRREDRWRQRQVALC